MATKSPTSERESENPITSGDIDRAIGARVRFRRQLLGWSQDELARLCCISSQQIHKYERGLSGIRPHRLLKLSEVLGVPVGWFFKGLELNTAMPTDIVAILANPQIAELVRGFQAIEDENVRYGLLEMIHTINRPKATRAPATLPSANRA